MLFPSGKVELIKVPLHIFNWGTISLSTSTYTAVMIPFILLGAFIGVAFIKKINEKIFKWLIIIVTIIAAIRLMF